MVVRAFRTSGAGRGGSGHLSVSPLGPGLGGANLAHSCCLPLGREVAVPERPAAGANV